MTYAEAVKRVCGLARASAYCGDMDIEALAVLRRAEPLLEEVEKCYAEDLAYCVGLYGENNPDVDPALDIIRAALAYRSAKPSHLASITEETQGKVVTREWLHQRAGLLSTMNFMGSHPEEALRWMLDLFREVGVKVED